MQRQVCEWWIKIKSRCNAPFTQIFFTGQVIFDKNCACSCIGEYPMETVSQNDTTILWTILNTRFARANWLQLITWCFEYLFWASNVLRVIITFEHLFIVDYFMSVFCCSLSWWLLPIQTLEFHFKCAFKLFRSSKVRGWEVWV